MAVTGPPNTQFAKDNRLDASYYEGRGPLAVLNTPVSYSTLIYPDDIGDLGHYVMFRVGKEYKFRSQQIAKKDTLAAIILPVPQNVQTGYNAQYQNQDLGVAGDLAAQAVEGRDLRTVTAGEALDMAKSGLATAAASEATPLIAGLLGGFSPAIAALGIQNVVPAFTGAKGFAVNPHQALLFQGTNFRTHSFNYKFMPRNRNEAERLQKIIKVFKFHMAPELTNSNHFFDYPEQFDIDFKHDRALFDIGTSVLTSFNVDYHGEGTPSYHGLNEDVQPTSISISMEFQETTITTKRNIKYQGR
jgi:hypothetical protein